MAQTIKVGFRRTNSRIYTLAVMTDKKGNAVLVPLEVKRYSRSKYYPHAGEKELIKAMRKDGSKFPIDILLNDGGNDGENEVGSDQS